MIGSLIDHDMLSNRSSDQSADCVHGAFAWSSPEPSSAMRRRVHLPAHRFWREQGSKLPAANKSMSRKAGAVGATFRAAHLRRIFHLQTPSLLTYIPSHNQKRCSPHAKSPSPSSAQSSDGPSQPALRMSVQCLTTRSLGSMANLSTRYRPRKSSCSVLEVALASLYPSFSSSTRE